MLPNLVLRSWRLKRAVSWMKGRAANPSELWLLVHFHDLWVVCEVTVGSEPRHAWRVFLGRLQTAKDHRECWQYRVQVCRHWHSLEGGRQFAHCLETKSANTQGLDFDSLPGFLSISRLQRKLARLVHTQSSKTIRNSHHLALWNQRKEWTSMSFASVFIHASTGFQLFPLVSTCFHLFPSRRHVPFVFFDQTLQKRLVFFLPTHCQPFRDARIFS